MTGIEPAYLAWEASALPLSYIGATSFDVTGSLAIPVVDAERGSRGDGAGAMLGG